MYEKFCIYVLERVQKCKCELSKMNQRAYRTSERANKIRKSCETHFRQTIPRSFALITHFLSVFFRFFYRFGCRSVCSRKSANNSGPIHPEKKPQVVVAVNYRFIYLNTANTLNRKSSGNYNISQLRDSKRSIDFNRSPTKSENYANTPTKTS